MDKTIFRRPLASEMDGRVNGREFLDERDSSGIEPDPWPGGRNHTQLDPGPPIPGQNCHIVIDGVGYIFADTVDMAQESRSAIGQEATAPFFGDPQNMLDTQSSDLTMLLPIGQSDFSDGIGAQRLEADPKGYESCNNLQLTPQKTLLNGPLINRETISGGSPQDGDRWWQEGYFASVVANSVAYDYFAIGRTVFYRSSGQWGPFFTGASAVTNLYGYSGKLLICLGDGVSVLVTPPTSNVPISYLPFKGFTVNGNPFICYKDGRIYSAFLPNPPAITNVSTETGPAASYTSYSYAVQYTILGTNLQTRLGDLIYTDKPANEEIVLGNLPVAGYKGGRVFRTLYRSKNNDSTSVYVLASAAALGDERVGWVDQNFDDTTLTILYDWRTLNNTAMSILVSGDIWHNMAHPDVSPIWFPESATVPATGDFVWRAETFHDTSGNEGVILGTTSGFFAWDGVSSNITELRPQNYNQFNCYSLAVNHGLVYFTLARTIAKAWSSSQETFVNGPWYSHFTAVDDVRLISAGEFVFFAVSGVTRYNPNNWTVSIYRYNGQSFDWQVNYLYAGSPQFNNTRPILGALGSQHSFVWYNNNYEQALNIITLDPKYQAKQTTNVMFRSSMSDCGLPRLRKQVFAVMVRYLQFTPQPNTTMRTIALAGATAIYVQNASLFNVGDWIAIDDNAPTRQEYRKITNVDLSNNVLWLYHTMGSELQYEHDIGTGVYRCGAVVTLRNVFADSVPIQDIEVGGPYRSDYLFSYIHLPNPVYTFLDGIEIDWLPGTIMELIGWSMITGLNPAYYGKMDLSIRLQDYVKLPNSLFDNATALERRTNLENAYNKGMVVVEDQFNQTRKMRFQRLSFNYEEPKQRHADTKRNQATAHVNLIDIDAELMKQESLVLGIPTNQ